MRYILREYWNCKQFETLSCPIWIITMGSSRAGQKRTYCDNTNEPDHVSPSVSCVSTSNSQHLFQEIAPILGRNWIHYDASSIQLCSKYILCNWQQDNGRYGSYVRDGTHAIVLLLLLHSLKQIHIAENNDFLKNTIHSAGLYSHVGRVGLTTDSVRKSCQPQMLYVQNLTSWKIVWRPGPWGFLGYGHRCGTGP